MFTRSFSIKKIKNYMIIYIQVYRIDEADIYKKNERNYFIVRWM
jgi:hypothetical protein